MKYEPHKYQEYATQRIIDSKASALFLDCGLGKTVITLTAIKRLKYERWEARKVLIIAPKTVAEDTWHSEAGERYGAEVADDMGLERINCKDCCFNSGLCEDCLFQGNPEYCPEEQEETDEITE